MNRYASMLVFLIIVVGGGISIGILTAPGEWYADLQKPSFNPPNWIFGPVWTVLYLMIAFVGWRIWQRGNAERQKRIWIVQMGLNFLWSPVFFAVQQPALALAVILSLLLVILHFIRVSRTPDRLSALLFIPYAMWVGFASVLNAAIVFLN